MKAEKSAVAIHEAGHAVVVLATPLRQFISHARIYAVGDKWVGDVQLDGRDRVLHDPHGAYEVANGLGGPVAQLQLCPDSIPTPLAAIIAESGGIIAATKRVLREKMSIESPWWPDLSAWHTCCKAGLFAAETDFRQIEAAIERFFRHSAVIDATRDISHRLVTEERLDRSQLLEISVEHLPVLHLPQRLQLL